MSDDDVITSDFYELEALLDDDDRAVLYRVRAFMDEQVTPVINDGGRGVSSRAS
jgi:glutaryl-CoA dehydrogenase